MVIRTFLLRHLSQACAIRVWLLDIVLINFIGIIPGIFVLYLTLFVAYFIFVSVYASSRPLVLVRFIHLAEDRVRLECISIV